MKKLLSGILLFFLMFFGLFSNTATAASQSTSFGPANWIQYRINATQNAVFKNQFGKLNTGTRVFKTGNQIRATPVVAGNNLYIGNHQSGKLYSFNIKTGKLNWENQAPNWVHSAMVYWQGRVFVGYGNRNFQSNGLRGTGKNGVMALDAKTGKILWNFPTKGEVMPTPVVYEGQVYVVTGGKNLYELNAKTGQSEWKLPLGSYVSMSSPVLSNGILYFGGADTYQFFAVDLNRKKILWKHDFSTVFNGLDDVPPAVSNHIVVTTALRASQKQDGNVTQVLYAMDSQTGKLLWQEPLGTGANVPNNKSGAPMIYNGKIFVGSPITKTVYAYDLQTGKKLWSLSTGAVKAPPVAENGIVYFATKQGDVYALQSKTGDLLGKEHIGGTLAPAGPIIVNHYLIVGSQDHNVYLMPTSQISGVQPQSWSTAPGSQQVSANARGISWRAELLTGAVILLILLSLLLVLRRRRRQ